MSALDRNSKSEGVQDTRRSRNLVPLRTPTMACSTDSLETEDMLSLPEPEPERRDFERHDVWEAKIGVSILPEGSDFAVRGRVRNLSLTGMWVDTAHPLPFKAKVHAQWCIEGGVTRKFSGRVIRSTPSGMAIQLDTNDPTWRFRTRFVELAMAPSAPPLSMTVHAENTVDIESTKADLQAEEIDQLYAQWQEIEKDLGNETLHQAFIHKCIQVRRLEYALERYRELRLLRPGLPSTERHIKQIGTILAFCTLKPDGSKDQEPPWWKKTAVVAIAIIMLAAGAMLIAQRFVAMEHERTSVVEDLRNVESR